MNKIGLKRGTVILSEHQDEWATNFETEKRNLLKLLGDEILEVEHIGSTSVPNLSAKPIIDMLVAVPNLRNISNIHTILENAGYEYRENGSNEEQVLFVKGSKENRTHYIHMTQLDSSVWKNDIAFRDYLRSHPEEVEKYEKLKQRLASEHAEDRGQYTAGKSEYIQGVIKKTK